MAIDDKQNFQRFENDPKGIRTCGKQLQSLRPDLIVMEPTGGYERMLLRQLHALELPVAVTNARKIREFARASGQLAKTDRLDAQIIARFAAMVGVAPINRDSGTYRGKRFPGGGRCQLRAAYSCPPSLRPGTIPSSGPSTND